MAGFIPYANPVLASATLGSTTGSTTAPAPTTTTPSSAQTFVNQMAPYATGGSMQPGSANNPTPTTTNTTPTVTSTVTPTTGTLSQAAINAALTGLGNTRQQNQNAFDTATKANAFNDTQQQAAADTQLQNNGEARSAAVQNAEQAAASGNEGLKAVLASLGALGGTGQILAGRAVANSANNDIGNANQTYTTNNEAIQKAITDYKNAVAARDATLKTNLANDNRSAATTTYQDLINQAENVGDTAAVSRFLPQLTQATVATNPIDPQSVLFNGANVGAYSPTNSVNVSANPSAGTGATGVTPVNSPLKVNKTGATPA